MPSAHFYECKIYDVPFRTILILFLFVLSLFFNSLCFLQFSSPSYFSAHHLVASSLSGVKLSGLHQDNELRTTTSRQPTLRHLSFTDNYWMYREGYRLKDYEKIVNYCPECGSTWCSCSIQFMFWGSYQSEDYDCPIYQACHAGTPWCSSLDLENSSSRKWLEVVQGW